MMLRKEKIVRQIQPGELHVVLVKRVSDGLVGIVYTRAPMDWLVIVSHDTPLAETEVRISPAAERIVSALRARFEIAHEPKELMPWFLIAFEQAVAALSEFNLRTGAPWLTIELHSAVYHIAAQARGVVVGKMAGGSFAVRLDGRIPNTIMARRDELKPIVRSPALASAET